MENRKGMIHRRNGFEAEQEVIISEKLSIGDDKLIDLTKKNGLVTRWVTPNPQKNKSQTEGESEEEREKGKRSYDQDEIESGNKISNMFKRPFKIHGRKNSWILRRLIDQDSRQGERSLELLERSEEVEGRNKLKTWKLVKDLTRTVFINNMIYPLMNGILMGKGW
ncbi:hypothetical protein BY996DRAFT_3838993 [Phakopsora pachyrhizi]|nr:hypothetical protein BY996DRAFT_3838993 [Phakopsora pachyrhizi]